MFGDSTLPTRFGGAWHGRCFTELRRCEVLPRALVGAVVVVLASVLSACEQGSEESTGDDSASALANQRQMKVVQGQTDAFSGRFTFEHEGREVQMSFAISGIDWEARTARFYSTVLSDTDAVSPDDALPLEIAIKRCPGCFEFRAVTDGETAVRVAFENSALKAFEYSGYPTTDAKVMALSPEPDAASEDAPAREGEGAPCGGFAGLTCAPGLRCDNSRGINTGFCR